MCINFFTIYAGIMKNLLGLCLLLFSFSLFAQRTELIPKQFPLLEEGIDYDSRLQSPAQFLGYELGQQFTFYADIEAYLRYLADQSDRLVLRPYGQSYEGRRLYSLVISSPDNLKQLETLRQQHLRLVDLAVEQPQQARQLAENQPVFVSLSYNIHGNEPSTTEAALQLAWRMAAATDAATADWLQQSVIILFVCINPDGRDRYVYWYNGIQRHTGGEEPADMEHYEPWPNGRSNHYWFDLNRDWVWGVHQESRGHIAEYQQWMPQVHVDYHEQGYDANYFTVPGEAPRNLLLPDAYEPWAKIFGRAHGQAFDARGISYFTTDRFDFFYPGYGSSYPSVMGAVGMLTEQGGIGAGRAVITNDGLPLTLRQRIFDHYLTSVASVRTAAQHRRELLQYSLDAWNPANTKTATKTYVLGQPEDPWVGDVVNLLLRQGVIVEKAKAPFRLADAMNYRDGQVAERSFPAGTVVVRSQQARHLLVHSLLSRQMAIEDSVMYDMSSWSAPLAYNLDAFSSPQLPKVALETISSPLQPSAGLVPQDNTYAFVIDWQQRHAPAALALLWEKGYRVRAAAEPFEADGKSFSAGSLLVLRGRNPEKTDIHADMTAIAAQAKVQVQSLGSSKVDAGRDLGSTRNQPLERPKVALLVEPPFDTHTSGQVFFLFDRETGLPVERVRASVLNQTAIPKFGLRYGGVDLSEYDVLILPGASAGQLEQVFPKEKRDQLLEWVKSGGVLIAMEETATFFTQQSRFNQLRVAQPAADSTEQTHYLSWIERERYNGLKSIPGAAFNARVDTSHPLAFGLKSELFSLRQGTRALQPATGLQTVVHYATEAQQLLAAGYAAADNLKALTGKTVAAVLPVEQGKIVYLVDNPVFRMFWMGPSRMLQNAVMLLPGF